MQFVENDAISGDLEWPQTTPFSTFCIVVQVFVTVGDSDFKFGSCSVDPIRSTSPWGVVRSRDPLKFLEAPVIYGMAEATVIRNYFVEATMCKANRLCPSCSRKVAVGKNVAEVVGATSSEGFLRYDMVDLRALKSWRDGQLNLAHGTETKNKEKK